ncbi:cytochrome b5 domain-containing protein [Mycolicibacterium arseniciresistens]|uniref:Cytochrome b5-like heme/steroid binding domain-containing protein n=1 Tax=Mycolicibacterium arseniciresistens TaxID=3062257 RepID=A0ABT8UMD2_9MYCO|nr:cytochrome b5-like heme/steroid binding domain-containing protein [Mycolicibacterium arseniciresistens]MDO3637965.1 cytochrome b5-like heme/steroid binding domain-containing protein [Mycolicibacterium arseniciresistens]
MKLKTIVGAALIVFAIVVTSILIANWTNRSSTSGSSQTRPDDAQTGGTNNQTLTAEEVARHNSASDCWIIINNNVFNVTPFINSHPGGAARITGQCGRDATTAFDTQAGQGSHSNAAREQLANLQIGRLGLPLDTPPDQVQAPVPVQAAGRLPPLVQARYPGAIVLSSEEDDDEQRYFISVNGQCREIRIEEGAVERDRPCD